MSLSYSIAESTTFNITAARYLTTKIAADLRTMHRFYGKPDLSDIDAFAEEAALLLRDGYLNYVDYGFRRDGLFGPQCALRLRYVATSSGTLQDDHPGGVPANASIADASWYSFLTYSSAFHRLSAAERKAVEATLPIDRTTGDEPRTGAGRWDDGRSYSRNGTSLTRSIFIAS